MVAEAIVLGGAGGIGSAVVRRLSVRGVAVHSVDIRDASSIGTHHLRCDLRDAGQVAEAFDDIGHCARQPPDLIVNCAGVFDAADDGELDLVRLARNMESNVAGPMTALNQWFSTFGRTYGGVAVNVSSASARRATRDVGYAMSKAALEAATRCLARAWGSHQVWVFGVAPGLVTSLMADAMTPLRRRTLVDHSLLRRESTADELAALIVALATTSPALLTGSVVDASGGRW